MNDDTMPHSARLAQAVLALDKALNLARQEIELLKARVRELERDKDLRDTLTMEDSER